MDPILRVLQRQAYSDPDNKDIVWQYLHHLERLTSETVKNQPLTEQEISAAAKAVGRSYAQIWGKFPYGFTPNRGLSFISQINENKEFTATIIFHAEDFANNPIEEYLWNVCYDLLYDHFESVGIDQENMEITTNIKYWDALNLNNPVYVEVKAFLPNFDLDNNQLNV